MKGGIHLWKDANTGERGAPDRCAAGVAPNFLAVRRFHHSFTQQRGASSEPSFRNLASLLTLKWILWRSAPCKIKGGFEITRSKANRRDFSVTHSGVSFYQRRLLWLGLCALSGPFPWTLMWWHGAHGLRTRRSRYCPCAHAGQVWEQRELL